MYNTGWAKSRRALDCFFIFIAEILGGYWQILDRSGKKIILLSPLLNIKLGNIKLGKRTQSLHLQNLTNMRVRILYFSLCFCQRTNEIDICVGKKTTASWWKAQISEMSKELIGSKFLPQLFFPSFLPSRS